MEATISQNFANILSTLTILSCLFLKVPQIMYIKQKKSAEGIYVQAMLMEIFGFSIMTLYNFTNNYGIMTYLEYPIILLQVYVMFYYVLKFKKMLASSAVPLTTLAYFSAVVGFVTGALPKGILGYLVPFCTPLSGFAKVTYIYGIIKEQNADAVSLTTWVISVSTNLARIFTVYVDSADFKLLLNFLVSTVLSSAVLGTAIYFKKCTSPQPTPRPRRKSVAQHYHSD
ncbi:solute carrier family 66 member 3 [Spodoptera frugiperda]|uniref:SFRICE_022048 n=1 Tax=Spodoptera frugiperda TaxID=7108 RepID=A0A2H1VVJ8_SPOFR|nr:solute carrier family 66 member 3 [Spodoptera frugiperda]XP_050559970.1 solute carrier family 66 member 3 [Spodoptera frugiperda]XP_050559971.1 solute carrier family 66 member 3 [Spodoptera frugiperda]